MYGSQDLADWLTVASVAELVDFCSFLSPTEGEARIRKAALRTIADAVTSIWTEARVEPFGSFVTGLCCLTHKNIWFLKVSITGHLAALANHAHSNAVCLARPAISDGGFVCQHSCTVGKHSVMLPCYTGMHTCGTAIWPQTPQLLRQKSRYGGCAALNPKQCAVSCELLLAHVYQSLLH